MTKEEAYQIIDLLAENPVNHAVVIKGVLALVDEDAPKKHKTSVNGVKPAYKSKKCKVCGKDFTPVGSRQVFCSDCKSRKQSSGSSTDIMKLAEELASM